MKRASSKSRMPKGKAPTDTEPGRRSENDELRKIPLGLHVDPLTTSPPLDRVDGGGLPQRPA